MTREIFSQLPPCMQVFRAVFFRSVSPPPTLQPGDFHEITTMPAKLQRMLRAFVAALSTEMDANDSPPECLHFTMQYGPWSLRVEARHGGHVTESPPDTPSGTDRASPPMRLDAIEAADDQWRTSAELAGRAGYPYSGRWRSIIAALVDDGILERDRRRHCLRRRRDIAT